MTRRAFDVDRFTPFSQWLRDIGNEVPKLSSSHISNQNIDYIWHNFIRNFLIMFEEKRFGGMTAMGAQFAQDDTHGIVAQMLQNSSGMTCTNGRGKKVSVKFCGKYKVVFENTTPDDGWMEINGVRKTREDLVALLETGFLPDHSKKKYPPPPPARHRLIA